MVKSTKAIFFDVDFTLIYPGPTFRGEGYHRFCAAHGISVDPSRFPSAVRAASCILDDEQQHACNEDIFVRYTRRIIEEVGGAGDRIADCAREISWCFGGIGLAGAAWMSRRASAVGLVALLAVASCSTCSSSSRRGSTGWWVTPFHYFHGAAILQNGTDPVRNLTALGGIGAVAASAAFWQFNRRDL